MSEQKTLAECPPGLFLFNGRLGFKSEYRIQMWADKRFHPDAYVVESGEYFCGGAQSPAERDELMVTPFDPLQRIASLESELARKNASELEAAQTITELRRQLAAAREQALEEAAQVVKTFPLTATDRLLRFRYEGILLTVSDALRSLSRPTEDAANETH